MSKSKHSPASKIEAVQRWLSGKAGQVTIARSLNISIACLQQWIRNYESMGAEAFNPSFRKRYSPELKNAAVQDYLNGVASLDSISKKYGIRSRSKLQVWIMQYNGHASFKRLSDGGMSYMTKGRITTLDERIEIVSYCISHNMDYGKTIKQYGVSYQQIYGWIKKYEADGPDGLVDRRGKRKDESRMTEVEKLRAQLKLKDAENRRLQIENDVLKKLEELERGRSQNKAL